MKKHLMATFLSAAMLFTSAAQAMEIRQFDKMADADQKEFIVELIQGAEKVLTDAGRADQAAQVSHLCDQISIGMTEFIRNLAIVRANDAKHAIDRPMKAGNVTKDIGTTRNTTTAIGATMIIGEGIAITKTATKRVCHHFPSTC